MGQGELWGGSFTPRLLHIEQSEPRGDGGAIGEQQPRPEGNTGASPAAVAAIRDFNGAGRVSVTLVSPGKPQPPSHGYRGYPTASLGVPHGGRARRVPRWSRRSVPEP